MIRQYRTLVRYSLLIPVLTICLVNLLYLVIVQKQAGEGRWIEDPLAKAWILPSVQDPDYIFIGSSRTQNNINTLALKKLGIDTVNLGVAGRGWSYYPYLIKRAKNVNPRTIVIGIVADMLFEHVNCPVGYFNQLQLDAMDATDPGCFFLSDMSWTDFLYELPINRFRRALEQIPSKMRFQARIQELEDTFGYSTRNDGRVVNYVRGSADRSVVVYRNGDGQIFSNRIKNKARIYKRTKNMSSTLFNTEAIAYMAKLANLIMESDIRIIYIIEPGLVGLTNIIDVNRLKSLLPENVEVINNADRNYGQELWADKGHFNLTGTKLYTQLLFKQLGALSKE